MNKKKIFKITKKEKNNKRDPEIDLRTGDNKYHNVDLNQKLFITH